MKLATAANFVKVFGGLVVLSGQANIIGVEAGPLAVGTVKQSNDHRKLEVDSPIDGQVVMGKFGDNGVFVATNATNFPQGTLNGTLSAGISNSEECTTDAYGKALKYSLKEPVAFTINELGMIEGVNENGWFNQTIRELEGNSTLPISLTELINGWAELMMNGLTEPELFNGVSMDYGLAVYVLGADEELLGCANIKILDKDTSAEYDKLIFGFSQEAVEEVPSSARKNGLFVFVSAVAAVGIAFVLGDILAL